MDSSQRTRRPSPIGAQGWARLDDGRYAGRLSGQPSAVWLTVAKEGRLEIDPRSTPGYIETTDGRIYELAVSTAGAESQRLQPVDGPATPLVVAMERTGVSFPRSPQELVSTGGRIFIVALSVALGFGMGVADTDRALERLPQNPIAMESVAPKPARLKASGAQVQVTRGGAALPAGLVEAKMQAKNSISQELGTSRSGTGYTDGETQETIIGIRYHLPFSNYDLNKASFARLSDGEQRRFERISVVPNRFWTGYVDGEMGLAIPGVRYHLAFTSYDIGQRAFDRLPLEEQLRFEKRDSGSGSVPTLGVILTKVEPILIDRNGAAN